MIVASLDTLRASHLGCYGYRRPTSPYLDHIASQGALFESAVAADIPTEAAHTAIFTGRPGISTGVVAHGADNVRLEKSVHWLPQILRGNGFTTAAVDNLYNLKEWFARGYSYYINSSGRTRWIDGKTVNAHAISWLKEHANEDFFLFLHYWDPHTPYIPREDYTPRFYQGDPYSPEHKGMEAARKSLAYPFFKLHHYDLLGGVTDSEYVSALYDAEIRYLDDRLRELDEALAEIGIADDTLLVLFGDHGESLTEHDIFWDHCGLYDTTVHVPLILRWPGHIEPGRRITGQVQHIDLMPTLLEACGLPTPEGVQGRSLWPSLRGVEGDVHERVFLSEAAWQASRGVRTREWKFIRCFDSGPYHREPRELYRLSEDPEERSNVLSLYPEVAKELEAQLLAWESAQLEKRRVDPMAQLLSTTGLPFRDRLRKIMYNFGMTWDEWEADPDADELDRRFLAIRAEREQPRGK